MPTQNWNEERAARLQLASLLATTEGLQVPVITNRLGPVDAWRAIADGDGATSGATAPSTLAETAGRHSLDELIATTEQTGAQFIIPTDREWPHYLFAKLKTMHTGSVPIDRTPVGLWISGSGSLLGTFADAVTITGARAATSYGEHVASAIGNDLAQCGVTVVTGAAFGVDSAALRGALAADGETAAILACGIDITYPPQQRNLLDAVRHRGLVVSEFPPGFSPTRLAFQARNRLLTAMTQGTVVVEAPAQHSGALDIANRAIAMRRHVMAVPGPVTSRASAGTNQLIQSGAARLVFDGFDVSNIIHGREPASPAQPTAAAGLDAAWAVGAAQNGLGNAAMARPSNTPDILSGAPAPATQPGIGLTV